MLKPLLTGVSLVIAALAATGAQARELTGPQITSLVAGATVEIDAPTGSKVPVHYSQEGRISGEARELSWYLGTATDRGRWWVAGDELCHKWLRWFNGEPQCMRIAREAGRAMRWTGKDGTTGTATVTVPASTVAQATALPSFGSAFARRFAEPPAAAPTPPPPARLDGSPPARSSAVVAAEPVAGDHEPAPVPVADPPPVAAPVPSPAMVTAAIPPASKPVERRGPAPRLPEATAPSPASHAAPKPPPQPRYRVANVRPDDVLNVRSGPSAEHDILGMLAPGSHGISVVGACLADWCPVQRDGTAGWVNSAFLAPEAMPAALPTPSAAPPPSATVRDSPEAPRACLTSAARALLGRIEQTFGPVQVISTCRAGALIANTRHPSRHASGNAVDFKAGTRRAAIIAWLVENHRSGGLMTYAGMDHIHVDIGPRFISLAGGRHWSSWKRARSE
jgi:hypothetical protein